MSVVALLLLALGALLLVVSAGFFLALHSRHSWLARHARVLREWRHHTHTDLDLILLYPALNMPGEERTAKFHEAAVRADGQKDRRGYRRAVRDLEYAYDLALSGAHHRGVAALPPQDRIEHQYAVDLRITAQDPKLPESVRRTALRKALDLLVHMDQLDAQTALDIYHDECPVDGAASDASTVGSARRVGAGGPVAIRPRHCKV